MKITTKMLSGFGAICVVVSVLGISMVWNLSTVGTKAELRVIGQRASRKQRQRDQDLSQWGAAAPGLC